MYGHLPFFCFLCTMVPSTHTFRIVDIDVKVIYKDVKRICLCIRPPDGRLEVTVPLHRSLEEVKGFVFAKRSWIAKHQEHFKKHARQEALSFISGEKLLFLGKKCTYLCLTLNSGFSRFRQHFGQIYTSTTTWHLFIFSDKNHIS